MGYYDIDEILAEDECLSVTTKFNFLNLSFLDEDALYDNRRRRRRLNNGTEDESIYDDVDEKSYLPESTMLESMPFWSIKQWFLLSFVSIQSLPRQFRKKFRDKLDASAAMSSVDSGTNHGGDIIDLRLRGGNYYYEAGMNIVNLVRSQEISRGRSDSSRDADLAHLRRETVALKRTILLTYSGERLRRILDWSLSCHDEDVSSLIGLLTEAERRLFIVGASSTAAFFRWKNNGMRPIIKTILQSKASVTPTVARPKSVTPNHQDLGLQLVRKRQGGY